MRTHLLRRFGQLLVAAIVWISTVGVALAQAHGKSSAPANKAYVTQYVLVVLIVGLGLAVMIRPAGRGADVGTPPKN